jgi:hypothetical protein
MRTLSGILTVTFNKESFMEREDKTCPYLKGGAHGAVCCLLDCLVREIRFSDIKRCAGGYEMCQVYRRYNEDYIDV